MNIPLTVFSKNVRLRRDLLKAERNENLKFTFYISSSLKKISTKLHIFVKFSMGNLLRDPVFQFIRYFKDIGNRDDVSKKGCPIC